MLSAETDGYGRTTMRAMILTRPGEPLVMTELPTPEPGPGRLSGAAVLTP